MARFDSLKPTDVLLAFQKAGFYIHERSGSHVQLKHRIRRGRVTIPNPQGFDLPNAIVRSIICYAGFTDDEFTDLLDE